MKPQLSAFLERWQQKMNIALQERVTAIDAPAPLLESMEYSLLAGGKRIRPIFLFATLEALEQNPEIGLDTACALEMIHTYSLIHDDLPAMDDDDYRRGKLTNHKVYGEAMAILAGDALLTHAFYLLAKGAPEGQQVNTKAMFQELSVLAGPSGMVGGQVADLLGENKQLTLEELYYIHQHKTADLLIGAVRLGGHLGQASEEQMEHLTAYAKHIGLAFQIQDDILDEVGDQAKLGKRVGSDKENAKTTFVSLLGMQGARNALLQHVQKSKEALAQADFQSSLLEELADYMIAREF